ncbi:hypothetical protein [Glycomyces xiaoerkulensis]|nr:hypothetical protein [Glycomyces xiaoerkulensis]
MDDQDRTREPRWGCGCLIAVVALIVIGLVILRVVIGDGFLDEWSSMH